VISFSCSRHSLVSGRHQEPTRNQKKKNTKIFERKQDLQDEAVLPVEVQIEIVKGFRVGTVHFVDSLAHLFVPQIIRRRKKTKINRREFGSTAIKKANKIKKPPQVFSRVRNKVETYSRFLIEHGSGQAEEFDILNFTFKNGLICCN
jgi:hypothetical protein